MQHFLCLSSLNELPLREDGTIERSAFSLEKGHNHFVLCDFCMDEASQC